MIEKGIYDCFGTDRDFISIDLHTAKHKNRVIDFLEGKNIVTDEYEYEVKAQWTPGQYHPNMTMTEDELIAFFEALSFWVEKIKVRRTP